VKTIKEHLRKVVSSHQRDWDERLPIFLMTNLVSTHETTGVTSANMVFGRELRLPCDLMFGAPRDKEQSTTDYTASLVNDYTIFTILPAEAADVLIRLLPHHHPDQRPRIPDSHHSRAKMMIVLLDRLAPYLVATRVEYP